MKNNKRETTTEIKKPISVPTIEPTPFPPPEPQPLDVEKKHKTAFLFGVIFLVFIILTTGTIAVLISTLLPKGKTIKTVELEVKDIKTDKDKKLTFDRSEWTFEVLNGSGVAGCAGKAAKKLESLDYTVIEIGNADKQTYTLTEVSVVKDKLDQTEFLLEDLKNEFPTATLSGELTSDSTASARLIIGRE